MTTVTRRTQHARGLSTPARCLGCLVILTVTSHSTWLLSLLSLSPHLHTIHDVRLSLSFSTSLFASPCFSFLFLSFFLMSDYDFDSVTNNLRDFANGTFVTLDDFSHFTSWRLMSTLIEQQFSEQRFLEDVDYDDTAFEDMLENAHREHVINSQRERVSVGQSSSSGAHSCRVSGRN